MCLIINDSIRKDKIKYIYKLFKLKNGKLYSFFRETKYKVGLNYPIGKHKPKNSKYFTAGGLHFYISIKRLSQVVFCHMLESNKYDLLAIRLPLNKKDVIHYGSSNDVVLNKVKISRELYHRAVKGSNPNVVLSNDLKVYW